VRNESAAIAHRACRLWSTRRGLPGVLFPAGLAFFGGWFLLEARQTSPRTMNAWTFTFVFSLLGAISSWQGSRILLAERESGFAKVAVFSPFGMRPLLCGEVAWNGGSLVLMLLALLAGFIVPAALSHRLGEVSHPGVARLIAAGAQAGVGAMLVWTLVGAIALRGADPLAALLLGGALVSGLNVLRNTLARWLGEAWLTAGWPLLTGAAAWIVLRWIRERIETDSWRLRSLRP
jgi:uncharacterized membrane protein YdcZ (DUF606 family)